MTATGHILSKLNPVHSYQRLSISAFDISVQSVPSSFKKYIKKTKLYHLNITA